jgi:hypothetical protein
MPKVKEVDVNYKQIRELVRRLDFEKKVSLLRDIVSESGYRKGFYEYTEALVKKYKIPKMSEEELDTFLHDRN